MKKRIEQLVEGGFTPAAALALASAEIQRGKILLAEGFKREAALARAMRDEKIKLLTAAKRQAGLEPGQAEAVATAQADHDERLGVEAVSKETAAEMLAEIDPAVADKKEKAKA